MATFGDLSSNKGLPPAFPPVDHVFPIVPVRQWVLSIPFALRYRLAYDSGLLSDVLNVFIRSRLWRTSPPRPGTLGVEVVAMRGRDVRAALRRCVESGEALIIPRVVKLL